MDELEGGFDEDDVAVCGKAEDGTGEEEDEVEFTEDRLGLVLLSILDEIAELSDDVCGRLEEPAPVVMLVVEAKTEVAVSVLVVVLLVTEEVVQVVVVDVVGDHEEDDDVDESVGESLVEVDSEAEDVVGKNAEDDEVLVSEVDEAVELKVAVRVELFEDIVCEDVELALISE